MLNLSENTIEGKINKGNFRAFTMNKDHASGVVFARILQVSFIILLILMFLPWTQNIRSSGYVTTLRPEERPQGIYSVISGKISKWYVKEGDFVQAGDTILHLTEVKDAYFDPNFVQQSQIQLDAKTKAVTFYQNKAQSLQEQLSALEKTLTVKLRQANNYILQAEFEVTSDSAAYQATQTQLQIADRQFERYQNLYDQGLKSLTDLEGRRVKWQDAQAKNQAAQNKLQASKNKLENAIAELESLENSYQEKISKAQSERFSTLSQLEDARAAQSKLQNQTSNYTIRSSFYYVTAPQKGYVTQAIRSGIGEIVKEGAEIATIMPDNPSLAVAMYVEPVDLPLMQKGEKVRFLFDGWPTVVFSGWPNLTYGSFGGKVFAIDNFISPNGKYRILVAPDPTDHPWPDALRVGSGADGIALLGDVPIWYELWRKLNGFPPDYYKVKPEAKSKK